MKTNFKERVVMSTQQFDYVLIGAGIMGLTIAATLKELRPKASIAIIEKEPYEAEHASGRNSGVLHAGFYYTADSLKARFTVEGSRTMKDYCRRKGLLINECGKLVVAQNQEELEKLFELEQRGKRNGSKIELIDEKRAQEIEPNVKTYKQALYSPLTASIDPKEVCASIRHDLEQAQVNFLFSTKYLGRTGQIIHTDRGDVQSGKLINCSGLYADKIAQDFGFGKKYTMIPFKGLYLKYTKNKTDINPNAC